MQEAVPHGRMAAHQREPQLVATVGAEIGESAVERGGKAVGRPVVELGRLSTSRPFAVRYCRPFPFSVSSTVSNWRSTRSTSVRTCSQALTLRTSSSIVVVAVGVRKGTTSTPREIQLEKTAPRTAAAR
jgi:hypothetical protein